MCIISPLCAEAHTLRLTLEGEVVIGVEHVGKLVSVLVAEHGACPFRAVAGRTAIVERVDVVGQ